jgi:class 3 adenylate cyclase
MRLARQSEGDECADTPSVGRRIETGGSTMHSEPAEMLHEPASLARLGMWAESVYRDLLEVERSQLDEKTFRGTYLYRTAILVLDVAGFSRMCEKLGEVRAFRNILNVHRVSEPALRSYQATLVRAFADDLVALFKDPLDALNAAFEIQRRMASFNSSRPEDLAVQCCFGIGYGDVFEIGPNSAMGNEMNYTSKLGESIAGPGEILLTESAYDAMPEETKAAFEEKRNEASELTYFRHYDTC